MTPTICVAEDRRSCEPALRILIASLARHCLNLPVEVFCGDPRPEFVAWAKTFPQVRINPRPLDAVWTKYDIKPVALAAVLRGGAEEAIWIDSDILVARDFRPVFAALDARTIAVTEEALCSSHADPDGLRARLWGFRVGRVLPFTANTGVVRVTREHLPLLERWHALLQSEPYRSAQSRPWNERGLHVMGDQEVLTALLAGEEFASLPIRFLRRGPDILQFFGTSGYTLAERLRHLWNGPPYFVHSQGYRPWWPAANVTGAAARFGALYNELSPYTVHARGYADALCGREWLCPTSPLAKIFTLFGCNKAPLTGILLAAASGLVRGAKLSIISGKALFK